MPKPRPALERFWEKVLKQDHRSDACWVWRGSSLEFYDGEKYWQAPRYSYFLQHGEDPGECIIVRTCTNKWCVRPSHLETLPSRGMPGQLHPQSKLKESDVLCICRTLRENAATPAELAQKYGVTQSVIANIAALRAWKHVKREVVPRRNSARPRGPKKRRFEAEDIREIRRKRKEEHALVESLGEEYGVNPSFISAICNYRVYKDIE